MKMVAGLVVVALWISGAAVGQIPEMHWAPPATAPQRCIYGPMMIMMPGHKDWGWIELGGPEPMPKLYPIKKAKTNLSFSNLDIDIAPAPGAICVPSKSPIYPLLLPTGTFMIYNDEGYVWPIAHFSPDPDKRWFQ